MTNPTSAPRSIGHLLEEIKASFDELDATAVEAEQLSMAPPALDAMIRKLRVPMVKAPLEVGGDHLYLADQMGYFEALSHANPTAGWTGFNYAGSAGIAGASLDDQGLELLFGSGRSPVMAAVSASGGTYRHVDGGVEARGTWPYASGVHTADWVMLTAIEETGGPPGVRLIIVDVSDTELGDDWSVMALKGTGSVNVTLNGTFVPDALVIDPLRGPARGGPVYTLGYQAYVSGENLGFTMGVCQRFLDEITEYAWGKTRGSDGRLADRGAFQYELGKGQLAVNAARAYGLQVLSEADTKLRAGSGLDATEQEAIVAVVAYSIEHATKAVSDLFHFAGAGALFDSNILQRCFRDAHGAVQHHGASNVAYDRFGRTLLAAHDPNVTG